MIRHMLTKGDDDQPVMTITVSGVTDVMRFTGMMLAAQVDIGAHAADVHRNIKRRVGAASYRVVMRRLFGEKTYLGKYNPPTSASCSCKAIDVAERHEMTY